MYFINSGSPPNKSLLNPYVFNPNSIISTPVFAWYDPTQGYTLDGSNNISQWNDESGNGYYVSQSTAADRPAYVLAAQNNLPMIQFNGSSTYLTCVSDLSSSLNDTYTAFFVIYPLTSVGGILYGGTDIGDSILRLTSNTANSDVEDYTMTVSQSMSVNTPYILGLRRNTATFRFYLNGAQLGTDQTFSHGSYPMLNCNPMGSALGGGSDFYTGYVGDILIYNTNLMGSDVGSIFTALNNKWSIY